ncbi:hypothetical protein AB0I51_00070 [Streptomyces sp. NPDC050549]|uniref:hypothetical protein n=1 Tax=Streptomyces sp. NPDC050549 TaxID=3155406 RepID=UPI00343DD283
MQVGSIPATAIAIPAARPSSFLVFTVSTSEPTRIQTVNGNLPTAVSGGGRTTEAVHTDATLSNFGSWEEFRLACVFVRRAADPENGRGRSPRGENALGRSPRLPGGGLTSGHR